MSSSQPKTKAKKSKPKAKNTPSPNLNQPISSNQQQQPQSFYRNLQDQPMYSPQNYHMPTNMYGYPSNYISYQMPIQNIQPQNQPQTQNQPQNQTQNLDDFNLYDPNFLTQFQTQMQHQSQPQPQHQSQPQPQQRLQTTQPRRLFEDEESSNEDEEESMFNYTLEDEDDEPEPEPEPEPQTRKRGKAKGKEKEPVQQSGIRLIWKDKEVKALAQAWLEGSEDDENGNHQDLAAFRQTIWEGFCSRMGRVYRNPEQIYAKWRGTNRSVMKFNGIYVNICRQPPSGANQMDIIGLAEQQYADIEGKAFKSKVFWDVVKNHPKWLGLKSPDDFTCGRGSKRSKTSSTTYANTESSDGRTRIDLNVEEEPSEPPPVHVGSRCGKSKKKTKRCCRFIKWCYLHF